MSENRKVRVAFVSEGGEKVDAGFEQTLEIILCDVSPNSAEEVQVLRFELPAMIRAPKEGGCKAKKDDACGGGKSSGGCGGGKKKEDVLDEKAVDARIEALAGVSVLFTQKTLHAYSALALNHAKVFSIRVDEPQYIADLIARIQKMLMLNPPLWLKRAVMKDAAEQEPELV